MDAYAPFEFVQRKPSPRLAGLVSRITGYRERLCGGVSQREAADLVVPLIVSLGSPFRIAFGRAPRAADRRPSFVGGLHAGPVHIQSDGGAECVQIDFTPLGAYRVFGGAVLDLADRIADIADVFGEEGRRLRERLGATQDWQRRFDMAESFVAARALRQPSPEVAFAYRRLARAGGATRIASLAEEIGWSRKHLAHRFRGEIGLGPKSVARMMRFQRACGLARAGGASGWAMIAAESGYADQAHLAREFAALAGETPAAWARRTQLAGNSPSRAADLGADW
jgi:AraC-like DNA-binding protein